MRGYLTAILFSLVMAAPVMADWVRPESLHGGSYMFNYYLPPFAASSPWSPAWSPDQKWVAVGMSGSIWKVNSESGEAFELTHDATYHSSPTWSPDGKWIVYMAASEEGNIQLEALNLEAGITKRLTNNSFIYTDPAFSPDGNYLAYASTSPAGRFNVYIRRIQAGQWSGDEIAVTQDHRHERDRPYFGQWDMHISPVWMPDGKSLLLVSNRGVELGSGNLLKVPARERGIEQAEIVLAEQTLFRAQPTVNRDGTAFFYSSTRGAADQFSNLYVAPINGGEPYKLTFFDYDLFQPRLSPDGERIVYLANRGGMPQLEMIKVSGGKRIALTITTRHWKVPAAKIQIRTADAVTGEKRPARISLYASDKKFYAPPNQLPRLSEDGAKYFYSSSDFEIEVPTGRLTIIAAGGFRTEPVTETIIVKEGINPPVDLRLRQLDIPRLNGWYSGTTHSHLNYGGTFHGRLKDLMMAAEAEDLSVINMLVANKDNRVIDYQHFITTGEPHPDSTAKRLLLIGQEYRPSFYGHIILLNLRGQLLSPFTVGLAGTALESYFPSNTNILRAAKSEGAIAGYAHGFSGDADPLEGSLGSAKMFPVDAALGTVDLLEWSQPGESGFFPWYALLNCGLLIPACGGEDSILSLAYGSVLGGARTFVYTGQQAVNANEWFRGLKAGRSFITTGPLMQVRISNRLPGERIALDAPGGEITIEGWVESLNPLSKVELVFNGEVIRRFTLDANRHKCVFKERLPVTKSGWFHLRATANNSRNPLRPEQAFSNPTQIIVGNQPIRNRASAEYLIRWVDKLQEMARGSLRWRSEAEREKVFAQFEEARRIYGRLLQDAQ